MASTKTSNDLTKWQKRYGRGFVMYSLKSGRAIVADPDYKKLIEKSKKKHVDREKVSVIYVPDSKTPTIFWL